MSLNRVMLIGNLGADPELRYTPSQQPVCSLRIATTERRKGADGQWAEQTEWHRVSVFGKTAENCSQYLAKGRQVFVEGRLQTRKYQDKETGKDRYSTEILAFTVQFLGGKGGEGGAPRASAPADMGSSDSSSSFTAEAATGAPVSFDDDDIPF